MHLKPAYVFPAVELSPLHPKQQVLYGPAYYIIIKPSIYFSSSSGIFSRKFFQCIHFRTYISHAS